MQQGDKGTTETRGQGDKGTSKKLKNYKQTQKKCTPPIKKIVTLYVRDAT